MITFYDLLNILDLECELEVLGWDGDLLQEGRRGDTMCPTLILFFNYIKKGFQNIFLFLLLQHVSNLKHIYDKQHFHHIDIFLTSSIY